MGGNAMMRKTSTLILIGLCLVLAACDAGDQAAGSTPSPTLPRVTVFKELGIEAELPGTGWIDIPYDMEDAEANGKLSTDNQLIFFVIRPNTEVKTDAEMKEVVDGFAHGGMVPPYTIERAEFQGYPSYVLEGVLNMPSINSDYRMRINFFTAHEKVHIVGAGTTLPGWTSTGKDQVSQLLNSVRVR
jgi:hypothetical protein